MGPPCQPTSSTGHTVASPSERKLIKISELPLLTVDEEADETPVVTGPAVADIEPAVLGTGPAVQNMEPAVSDREHAVRDKGYWPVKR